MNQFYPQNRFTKAW